MSANCLYHTWFRQIRQLLPDEPITRVTTGRSPSLKENRGRS